MSVVSRQTLLKAHSKASPQAGVFMNVCLSSSLIRPPSGPGREALPSFLICPGRELGLCESLGYWPVLPKGGWGIWSLSFRLLATSLQLPAVGGEAQWPAVPGFWACPTTALWFNSISILSPNPGTRHTYTPPGKGGLFPISFFNPQLLFSQLLAQR